MRRFSKAQCNNEGNCTCAIYRNERRIAIVQAQSHFKSRFDALRTRLSNHIKLGMTSEKSEDEMKRNQKIL